MYFKELRNTAPSLYTKMELVLTRVKWLHMNYNFQGITKSDHI